MAGMQIATKLGTEIALSALSSVINKLGTYLGGDVTTEEMEHLRLFLLSEISVFIEEGKSNDFVQSKPLLEKLQETALRVDDLQDLYEYNQINKQVSSSSTNFIKKLVSILKENIACVLPKSSLRINLEKLLNFVEQVEKKYPFIKSAKTNGQRTQQKHKSLETTSTIPSPYFGRDKQYKSIVELLLAEPQTHPDGMINVPVIAIKGIGGSGKSHTAQRICNDERITTYFGKPIWIHVTTDFDVEKLTKKLIESASGGECPRSTSLEGLQTSLKESILERNRFLLILDDVWCENTNKWEQLVGPLNEAGRNGSKIILTTREERVAHKHAGKQNVISLDELEVEDCWSILKYYAFKNSKHHIEDPELVDVGTQIISKARSSPLALKVVGSSLRDTTNVGEWEKILKRDILGETMDLLSFSFQRLPSHLQRCFAYCSLFPKGYVHNKHLLVPLCIAQGYIENTNDESTLEEKGSMYIDDLLSYSFFEKTDSSDDFVIHDLLHDLAERASGNLCHRIENHASVMNIPPKCIHLSMYSTMDFESIEIPDISILRHLRSLIILDDVSCTNIFRENTDIFQILSKLRALYVKYDRNMEVLSNPHIDQLKHLRFLHLYYDKKLPKSLVKLYHLQFFHLNVGSIVTEVSYDRSYYGYGYGILRPNILPQGFGNLINLRAIKISNVAGEVDYLKYNSKVINIGKLESLQTVPVFYPEDKVDGMVPLKILPLRGSLRICDLENVKSKGDAEKAMLKQKKNLNELILKWGRTIPSILSSRFRSSDSSDLETDEDDLEELEPLSDLETYEDVLEGLKPHQNLKSLEIEGYKGVKIANWMWSLRQSLSLFDCKNIREIGSLSRLQSLILFNCKNIREIGFLPRLQSLTLLHCKNIREIGFLAPGLEVIHVGSCEELTQLPPFGTALNTLILSNCPVLRRLQSMSNNSISLHLLEVEKCPMLMTDELSLLAEKVAERDTTNLFSEADSIELDEPLLILALVQQQGFNSITELDLRCTEAKPFPQWLEDHFSVFSSLRKLSLRGFKTLPNTGKLPALKTLYIYYCPGVELLPNLPPSLYWLGITGCPKVELLPNLPPSLDRLSIYGCPKLKANYNNENGPFHKTISHMPDVSIY